MAPQVSNLQFNQYGTAILDELFDDTSVIQTNKKTAWEKVCGFFVPEEFEIRSKKDVIFNKLKQHKNITELEPKLNAEEEKFLKAIVKAYLSEEEPDDETFEQRARLKWRDLNNSIAKGKLSEEEKKELYNWILAREKELHEFNQEKSITIEAVRRKIAMAMFSRKRNEDETEEAYLEALRQNSNCQKLADERSEAILSAAKAAIDDLLTAEKSKKEIEEESTYKVNTAAKQLRYFMGWLFSLIYSLGCGITTAGAFLIVMSGGALIPLFVAILVAGFVINYAFTRKNTPEVFTYAFSGKDMFVNMFKDLTLREKIAKGVVLGVAIVAACATGFAAGILTYTGALGIIAFFGLSAFPPALVAAIAIISAVCITTVMVRGIVKALEGKPLDKIKTFFASFLKPRMVNQYDKDGILVGEVPESKPSQAFRIGFTIFLFVAFFGFAVMGCLLNMFSAHLSMVDIFWKTHQLALNASIAISATIASLSVVGEFQLHLDTAKEAAKALINPFIKFYEQAKLIAQNKAYSNPKKVAIIVLASLLFIPILLINMFGNGMVAGMGSSGSAALTFSAVIAALESFIDTFRDYLEFMGEQIGDWARASSKVPAWLAGTKEAILHEKQKQVVHSGQPSPVPHDADEGNSPDSPQRIGLSLGGEQGRHSAVVPPVVVPGDEHVVFNQLYRPRSVTPCLVEPQVVVAPAPQ